MRITRDIAVGAAAGAVAFAAAAAGQLVITELAAGIVGGAGGVTILPAPQSAWPPGLVVLAVAGLLLLSRDLWWSPRGARVAAAVAVAGLTVVGVVLFYPAYAVEAGTGALWRDVLVSGAQSTASYAFVGVVAASLLVPRRSRREA
jgi:hypothetical protein